MYKTDSVSNNFNIKILELESDQEELKKLAPQFCDHKAKIQQYLGGIYEEEEGLAQGKNQKIIALFRTSWMELMKVEETVTDRINQTDLTQKYKIVVAYDSCHQLPQAIGLVLLDRKEFEGRKTIELHSLITSVWNLNCPQNLNHPHQVRGAGSSIINFCKKLGVENHAKFLYLSAAFSAVPFYESHNFKLVNLEDRDRLLEEDPFAMNRIDMFLDLEV